MAYKKYSSKNLAQGPLAAGIPASGEALQLETWYGALFPTSFPFKGILEKFDDQTPPRVIQREMVECTARTADTLTIARGAGLVPASWDALTQSNVPMEFAAGDTFSLVVSSEQMDDVQDEVTRLETDKLDKDGATRTGLTAKRVLVTDGAGGETYVSGTDGQVLSFDADGDPVATTPTVTITDAIKQETGEYFFGDGSDGSLTVSSGTTTLTATSDETFKQYVDLTISGTGILACAGKINHIYVSGTLAMSAGSIHANGYGGGGAVWPTTATTAGSNWTNGNGIDWATVSGRDFYAGIGTAASGNWSTSTGGAGGALGTFKANERGRIIRVSCGGGGGSSGSPYNTAGAGGSGGGGGGVLVIIANRVNITGGTVSSNGIAGTAGTTSNRGGGGGGGGGAIVMLYGTLIADTATWQCNGGNGWASNSNGWYSTGSGGGGGGGWFGIAWGNGGNGIIGGGANAGWTPASNAYWTGWTGWAGGWGGGGGGGAPGVYYKAKARIN